MKTIILFNYMTLDDKKIGEILISQSYITDKDLKEAMEYAKSHDSSITDYLFSEGVLSKELVGQAIAEYLGVPYADLGKEKIDEEIFEMIPELVARSNEVVALSRSEEGVKIGMTNPIDLEFIHILEKRVNDNVIACYITKQDFENVLARYKKDIRTEFKNILNELQKKNTPKEKQDELVVTMVDMLFENGYQNNASDIHVEPYAKKIVIRFRIDGIMHDVLEIPKNFSELILSRIKIMSKLRTDEHRAAQDGKLKFKIEGQEVDVRISIVPVTHGENVVMRILSDKNRRFSLTDLGFSETDLKKMKKVIKNPHGMILVTGPTGSGKTTTLYAVLKMLNRREVHISTIEDPVEYDIESITQIQVNIKTDLTFAKGLRAIVRQDPDIIMVGEIRDEETADIAVNSALTGHLVLSTLHTNDAPTTLPRLLDMDVEPFLVASTVSLVVAQRLVRQICPKCRVSYQPEKEEKAFIESDQGVMNILKNKGYKNLSKIRFYKSTGCNACANTGYSGRLGIFEVMEMSEEIKQMILKNASSDEIMKVAIKQGMTTMFEDGIDKVINGLTTIQEVMRVSKSS